MVRLGQCEQSELPLMHLRTVQIMSYLPLKGLSRAWGWFNELEIPYYLRVPGFRLYSWVFGVKSVFPMIAASTNCLTVCPRFPSLTYTRIPTLLPSSTGH